MNNKTVSGRHKIVAVIAVSVLLLNVGLTALAQSAAATANYRFKDVKYLKTTEKKADEVEGELEIDQQKGEVRVWSKGAELFKVDKQQVTGLLYERTSRPRYVSGLLLAWPLLFTKGKKHFLTIQYKNAEGQGAFTLLRLDKSNYQQILASVEAATGVKVERTID
jgi:hypothetical protein